MKTTLVEDVAPLADDTKLLRGLNTVEHGSAAGVCFSIGIEGPTSAVYRVIQTQTLIEAISVFEVLQDFGLKSTKGRREAGILLTRIFYTDARHDS